MKSKKEGKAVRDNLMEIQNIVPGTTIEAGGIKMEVLDCAYASANEKEIGVLCLAKDILFQKKFDKENNNNWEKSSLREYLNGKYKKNLDKELVSALLPFKRNLMSDDGTKDYGICVDLVSLISEREYQDYRDYISDKPSWWWTLTAWSVKLGDSHYVQGVTINGNFSCNRAQDSYNGICPVFLLLPSLKVKIVN